MFSENQKSLLKQAVRKQLARGKKHVSVRLGQGYRVTLTLSSSNFLGMTAWYWQQRRKGKKLFGYLVFDLELALEDMFGQYLDSAKEAYHF